MGRSLPWTLCIREETGNGGAAQCDPAPCWWGGPKKQKYWERAWRGCPEEVSVLLGFPPLLGCQRIGKEPAARLSLEREGERAGRPPLCAAKYALSRGSKLVPLPPA